MTTKEKHRALRLWEDFAYNTRRLDAEATEALFGRDRLEAAERTGGLTADELKLLHNIDREVSERAEIIRAELEASTALQSVVWWRESKGLNSWWWQW